MFLMIAVTTFTRKDFTKLIYLKESIQIIKRSLKRYFLSVFLIRFILMRIQIRIRGSAFGITDPGPVLDPDPTKIEQIPIFFFSIFFCKRFRYLLISDHKEPNDTDPTGSGSGTLLFIKVSCSGRRRRLPLQPEQPDPTGRGGDCSDAAGPHLQVRPRHAQHRGEGRGGQGQIKGSYTKKIWFFSVKLLWSGIPSLPNILVAHISFSAIIFLW